MDETPITAEQETTETPPETDAPEVMEPAFAGWGR
jgi:hypothetical protein